VRREIQDRRNKIYRTASPSPDRTAVNAQLTQLQAEALARVTPILGSTRALDAYKQYGGTWLVSLVPRPAPSPAANRK
jgi:hypothetical protein